MTFCVKTWDMLAVYAVSRVLTTSWIFMLFVTPHLSLWAHMSVLLQTVWLTNTVFTRSNKVAWKRADLVGRMHIYMTVWVAAVFLREACCLVMSVAPVLQSSARVGNISLELLGVSEWWEFDALRELQQLRSETFLKITIRHWLILIFNRILFLQNYLIKTTSFLMFMQFYFCKTVC